MFDHINGAQYRALMEDAPFTDEEAAIFTKLRRGKSAASVAMEMHISDRTMSRRIASIRGKINRELP